MPPTPLTSPRPRLLALVAAIIGVLFAASPVARAELTPLLTSPLVSSANGESIATSYGTLATFAGRGPGVIVLSSFYGIKPSTNASSQITPGWSVSGIAVSPFVVPAQILDPGSAYSRQLVSSTTGRYAAIASYGSNETFEVAIIDTTSLQVRTVRVRHQGRPWRLGSFSSQPSYTTVLAAPDDDFYVFRTDSPVARIDSETLNVAAVPTAGGPLTDIRAGRVGLSGEQRGFGVCGSAKAALLREAKKSTYFARLRWNQGAIERARVPDPHLWIGSCSASDDGSTVLGVGPVFNGPGETLRPAKATWLPNGRIRQVTIPGTRGLRQAASSLSPSGRYAFVLAQGARIVDLETDRVRDVAAPRRCRFSGGPSRGQLALWTDDRRSVGVCGSSVVTGDAQTGQVRVVNLPAPAHRARKVLLLAAGRAAGRVLVGAVTARSAGRVVAVTPSDGSATLMTVRKVPLADGRSYGDPVQNDSSGIAIRATPAHDRYLVVNAVETRSDTPDPRGFALVGSSADVFQTPWRLP